MMLGCKNKTANDSPFEHGMDGSRDIIEIEALQKKLVKYTT